MWSLYVKRPRTSDDVQKIAFRYLCEFGCVLAYCVACLMLNMFGDVFNTYTKVFIGLTSGYDFTYGPQGR